VTKAVMSRCCDDERNHAEVGDDERCNVLDVSMIKSVMCELWW
jgi:hypothetical protein